MHNSTVISLHSGCKFISTSVLLPLDVARNSSWKAAVARRYWKNGSVQTDYLTSESKYLVWNRGASQLAESVAWLCLFIVCLERRMNKNKFGTITDVLFRFFILCAVILLFICGSCDFSGAWSFEGMTHNAEKEQHLLLLTTFSSCVLGYSVHQGPLSAPIFPALFSVATLY